MFSGLNRHASLPEDLEEETVDTMMTGQVAYIVPWGMWVDSDRRCWLHPKYTVKPNPIGTVSMRIQLMPDGFHVWVPAGESWSPSEAPGYMSPSDTKWIAVTELHR